MIRRPLSIALLAVLGSTLASCHGDDDPAAIAGSYTIAITNGKNACKLQNWNEGDTSSNIPFTITQDGSSLMSTVEGAAAIVIVALLGSADYDGHADGNSFVLKNFGTRSFTSGGCAFTIKSTVNGSIAGDVLMGTIEYTPVTNESPACMNLEACSSEQLFNGTRPPMLPGK
jgi:hypothetical protein